MSYDPSHRKPPRQERWPQATPPAGWPSYRDDDTYQDGEHAGNGYAADRQGAHPATVGYRRQAGYQGASDDPGDRGYQSAVATDTFPPGMNGYGSAAGFGPVGGYGDAADGYDWTADGHGGTGNGYGAGYGGAGYGGAGYGGAGNVNGGGGYGTGNGGGGHGTGNGGSGHGTGNGGSGHGTGNGGSGHGGAGNGDGPGGYPSDGYARGINGYAAAADDFAEAADGYGSTRNGYAGTVSGYPNAVDGYADAGDSFAGATDRYSRTASGYGQAIDEYVNDANGYDWNENGYAGAADGYGNTANGYAGAADAFAGAADAFAGAADAFGGAPDAFGGAPDGYAGAPDGYAAPDDFAGSAGYLGPGSYTEPGFSDPMLVAPDAGVDPGRWQADQDLRREAGRRGPAVGAVTGLLAAAVAIGVSTLAAGFARPQASPVAALGSVFIDRMPTALKNVALQHFGTHGRTVLLLGMYAAIAVLAVWMGVLTRRGAAPGVAALGAFSLIAAFVTITRPGGHVGDVAPAIVGGMAGVAALLWLRQASAPTPPLRQTRGNSRRRGR